MVINGVVVVVQYGLWVFNGVVFIIIKWGKAGKFLFSYFFGFNVNELCKLVYVNLRGEQFGSVDQCFYFIVGINVDGNFIVGVNFFIEKVLVICYDYQDQIFDIGYGIDQYFLVCGGNEQFNYYVLLLYIFNEGIICNMDF